MSELTHERERERSNTHCVNGSANLQRLVCTYICIYNVLKNSLLPGLRAGLEEKRMFVALPGIQKPVLYSKDHAAIERNSCTYSRRPRRQGDGDCLSICLKQAIFKPTSSGKSYFLISLSNSPFKMCLKLP